MERSMGGKRRGNPYPLCQGQPLAGVLTGAAVAEPRTGDKAVAEEFPVDIGSPEVDRGGGGVTINQGGFPAARRGPSCREPARAQEQEVQNSQPNRIEALVAGRPA